MSIVADTWLLFTHNLRMLVRNPIYAIIGLFQPLVHLFLFAPLLQGLTTVPNFPPGGPYIVYVPGLLVMLAITSSLFVGFSFLAEVRVGVLERMRVTRVSRVALVLGRSLVDVLMFLVQSTVLIAAAWLMGMIADPTGVAVSIALLLLLSLFTSLCSYSAALALKDETSFSSLLNFLMMPLLLLSGITLPLSLAPQWIRSMAAVNPFAYAVDATRLLFIGNLSDAAVTRGFVIAIVITGLALVWAVRSFRRGVA